MRVGGLLPAAACLLLALLLAACRPAPAAPVAPPTSAAVVLPDVPVNCPRGPFPYPPARGTVLPPTPAPLLPADRLAFAFTDLQHGWVAWEGVEESSETSQIWATTDAGETWTILSRTGGVVVALDFVSPVEGWAVVSGNLLSTGDGGKTWQTVQLPQDERARYVDFVDARYGWLAGNACAIAMLQTADGGRRWSALPVPCEDNGLVAGLTVTAPGSGWVLCDRPARDRELWRTRDAGASWQRVNASRPLETPVPNAYPFILTPHPTLDPARLLPSGGPVAGMSFAGDEHGWIAQGSALWATSDGGVNWRQVLMNTDPRAYGPFSAPRLVSATQGYAISRTYSDWGVFRTQDGGLSWTHVFPRPSS